MSTDTSTETIQEPAKPKDDGENKSTREAKINLVEILWKSIGAPEIKETPTTAVEAAFSILKPGNKGVLCYCTNKKDAELVAAAIRNAARMAVASVIL